MTVQKRDGRKVKFDKEKIKIAVLKAFIDVDGEETSYAKEKARDIANYIESLNKSMTVEEIQDFVEERLMASNRKDVARKYIIYRNNRTTIREKNTQLMKDISEKLNADNVQNQNANVDEKSFGGRVGEASDTVLKKYALDNCMSEMARNNHLNNEIYIHDLNSYAVGMHNCYDRETKFLTDEGIRAFKDFHDGDSVKVLNMDGKWSDATVHMYGRQPMYEITLSRAGKEVTVISTRNHRWILSNGKITDNLQVGDHLFSLVNSTEEKPIIKNKREAEMFCLGFILGDGVDHEGFLEVRLCGKKCEYLDYFKKANYKVTTRYNEPYATKKAIFTKQEFLSNKLWRILSFREKQLLFDGYYAADGHKTTDIKSIATSDDRTKCMIEELSALAGYHICSFKEEIRDTNYKDNAILYTYVFTTHHSQNTLWKVKDIKKGSHRNKDYEAWCVEEPETHSFTLEGGIVTGNCLSVPFDKLLAKGFNTRQTDVRPAQSVSTAFQLVAVIFQLQSLQQFGGVSATHLDWTMIPYVRKSFYKHLKDGLMYMGKASDYKVYNEHLKEIKENHDVGIENSDWSKYFTEDFYIPKDVYDYALDMTEKEVYQAVEGLYHNLNTLQSRSGNQLPFTSINYGTCTEPEGRMVTKALLEVSINGIGKLHKTSIFPCGIFQCMKGVNRKPEDPNYDLFRLALKSTAQRLYPNYANVDWSGNEGYDRDDPKTYFSTMGCRTANGWDINGFGQLKDGRGNICPVTIIMPTLAMEAKEPHIYGQLDDDEAVAVFLKILDRKIHEAKDMLLERYEWICSQSPDSAKFMYENGVMEGYDGQDISSALKHGTLAIGQLGLAETLQILIGCDHTTDKGMKLAKQIEQLFKDKCAEFKEQYKLNFGVYYTPAENLCFTAMNKFQEKYGEIPNVSDKKFFTNSIHVPVWIKMTPTEKIDIESQLTGYSSAGCITYVELEGSVKNNLDALETIINYAMDKDIPYFAINVPNDMCNNCGYCDDINNECPMCGCTEIRRLRRVTGYLTGDYKSAFNLGKQQEVEMRIKHQKF